MAIIFFGRRAYGKVEHVLGTFVLTTFFHVWFIPLFPLGSYVLARDEKGVAIHVPIGLHVGSILAGYLRTWCALLSGAVAWAAVQGAREYIVTDVPIWIDGLVLAAALAVAWFGIGRVSATRAAQRAVYAKFVGLAVDVARFSQAQAASLRETLDTTLTSEGHTLAFGYRDAPDPCTAWREVALHPSVHNTTYLEAALTRARLEWGRADRRERPALHRTHDQIWDRLIEHTGSPA